MLSGGDSLTGGAIVTTHLLTGATPAARVRSFGGLLRRHAFRDRPMALANLGQPQGHHNGYIMANSGY